MFLLSVFCAKTEAQRGQVTHAISWWIFGLGFNTKSVALNSTLLSFHYALLLQLAWSMGIPHSEGGSNPLTTADSDTQSFLDCCLSGVDRRAGHSYPMYLWSLTHGQKQTISSCEAEIQTICVCLQEETRLLLLLNNGGLCFLLVAGILF